MLPLGVMLYRHSHEASKQADCQSCVPSHRFPPRVPGMLMPVAQGIDA